MNKSENPHTLPKSNFVGLKKGDGPSESWNGSVWASLFADIGIFGLFLGGLLIGVLLSIYDSATRGMDMLFSVPILIYICFAWGEVALQTSIITYGVGPTIIILALLGSGSKRVA